MLSVSPGSGNRSMSMNTSALMLTGDQHEASRRGGGYGHWDALDVISGECSGASS